MEETYLFYNEYEEFYEMAKTSEAFKQFCKNAFGADFSQDGFSDLRQIDRIMEYFPKDKQQYHILDIGCGNGKMVGYIQTKLPAFIYGFDYSEQAISHARELFPHNSEFKRAVIGETDYPAEKFDVIISMDTMYFAKDMTAFVGQIKKWLNKDGVFIVGYQEGDVVPKTEHVATTRLAEALRANEMSYRAVDITEESYEVLKKKYDCAMALKEQFTEENNQQWFDMLIEQTEYANTSFETFQTKMARYIYIVKN